VEPLGHGQDAFELLRRKAGHPGQEPTVLELEPEHRIRLEQPTHHPLVDHRRGQPTIVRANLEEPIEGLQLELLPAEPRGLTGDTE